jgi:hypothetical protein
MDGKQGLFSFTLIVTFSKLGLAVMMNPFFLLYAGAWWYRLVGRDPVFSMIKHTDWWE